MFILFSFFFLVTYLILLMFCYIMYWPTNNSNILRHYSELCWASGCESRCAMLSQLLWIIVSFAEPVVVNQCELCWASGSESRVLFWAIDCESLWVLLSQWLWTIASYPEPVVVKHWELCWAQCVGIVICYAEGVGVNHCELCWASGCESWCVILGK